MSDRKTFYANLVAAVNEQDLPRIQELIDPSFVIHYDSSLPFGGTYRGAAGFITVLTKLSAMVSEVKTEQLNYLEDTNGEQYALIIKLSAVLIESGKSVETQVSEVWTVRAGKAVEARIWYWGASGLFGK